MADGIGRIFGGNSYGIGGNFIKPKNEEKTHNEENTFVQPQAKEQIDPNKIMEFLNANNNIFVEPKTTTPVELSPEVQDRVVNAMERFESIYPVVVQEFGEQADLVMDLVMDKLLGLAL